MTFHEYMIKKMEEKLLELMGQEAYNEFAMEVAKEGFKQEINGMAESGFKNFCLEYMPWILGEEE